jgi:hypothetical protein
MSSRSEAIRHGYSTIRAVLDDRRGRSVIVGVVAWDTDAEWYKFRTIAARERVPGVTAETRSFADIAMNQLSRWAERKSVPYATSPALPWTSAFWIATSRIMTTAIRVDPPRAMSPLHNRTLDFESLFEAVVQPLVPSEQRKRRIDGFVTSALGTASRVLRRGAEFQAFGGTHESVLRGAVGDRGGVVVEGVNLASANARKEADALVSKLLRIKAAPSAIAMHVVVGYVASPGGLNGETDMRDWIRETVTPDVFDLVSEDVQFQAAATAGLDSAGLERPEN